MRTATEQGAIDSERLMKMYQADLRARQIVDMCVANALNEKGEPTEYGIKNYAREVASEAVATLLLWIYDNDGEIKRVADERDHYKRIAEEAFRVLPATFQIKAATGQFELASADTHPKGQDPAEGLGS